MVPPDVDVPTVEKIIYNLVFCDLIRGFAIKIEMGSHEMGSGHVN